MKTPSLVMSLCLVVLFAISAVAASGPQGHSTAQNMTPAAQNQVADQNRPLSQKGIDRIIREVHHQLVLLPFYGVFDNLAYKVDPDGTVTLMGQVVRPTLKDDAERAVKRIEGVTKVINNIEVLPTSFNDDRIRRATYRAIYGNEVLNQYQLRAVPPIHIIVNNGHVTLDGVVARQMDKQIAETQAKSVPGVFSVTDDLRVEEQQGNNNSQGDKKK